MHLRGKKALQISTFSSISKRDLREAFLFAHIFLIIIYLSFFSLSETYDVIIFSRFARSLFTDRTTELSAELSLEHLFSLQPFFE